MRYFIVGIRTSSTQTKQNCRQLLRSELLKLITFKSNSEFECARTIFSCCFFHAFGSVSVLTIVIIRLLAFEAATSTDKKYRKRWASERDFHIFRWNIHNRSTHHLCCCVFFSVSNPNTVSTILCCLVSFLRSLQSNRCSVSLSCSLFSADTLFLFHCRRVHIHIARWFSHDIIQFSFEASIESSILSASASNHIHTNGREPKKSWKNISTFDRISDCEQFDWNHFCSFSHFLFDSLVQSFRCPFSCCCTGKYSEKHG